MSWQAVEKIWASSLESHEKAVMAPTASHANKDGGNCHPSARTIAEKASLSDRQVRRVWADMRERGILEVVEWEQGTRAVTYRIRFDRLPSGTPDTDVKGKDEKTGILSGTLDAHVTPDVDVTPDAHVIPPLTPTSATLDTHVKENHQEPPLNQHISGAKTRKRTTFKKPDQKEVTEYFLERNSSKLESEKFYDHFESNGWKVSGRTKMKDWKAAARNWIRNVPEFNRNGKSGDLPESGVIKTKSGREIRYGVKQQSRR
jgi:hypothetical protein